MIIVTGAAGFIGSCMVGKLNEQGISEITVVDDFSKTNKAANLADKHFTNKVERTLFFEWLEQNAHEVEFIFHIGARTDTTEFNMAVFDELNLNYSKSVWNACSKFGIPLLYASSAATYGDGSYGYSDLDPDLSFRLKPLNPYGISKNEFDKWAIRQIQSPPRWYGMKFFNVFGPNEYHKGRMASVVFHAFNQVQQTGSMKLFRSHHPGYTDGGQLRDFIYVKDLINVLDFLRKHPADSGIYNLGTGRARTFLDLARSVFSALHLEPDIEFIDTPLDIRDKYQYFTEAKMEKLYEQGYLDSFTNLELAVNDYVEHYLANKIYF